MCLVIEKSKAYRMTAKENIVCYKNYHVGFHGNVISPYRDACVGKIKDLVGKTIVAEGEEEVIPLDKYVHIFGGFIHTNVFEDTFELGNLQVEVIIPKGTVYYCDWHSGYASHCIRINKILKIRSPHKWNTIKLLTKNPIKRLYYLLFK